jgi:hypothetical protein
MNVKIPGPTDRAGRIAAFGLAAVVVYHLALLFPAVRYPFPFVNDSVLHFGLVKSLADARARGQGLLDPWVSSWGLGFPVFHYYQDLPHLLVLAVSKLSLDTLSLVRAFKTVEWLAIGTFPLPVFLAMRILGFGRTASLAAATLSLWIRTDYQHGHDFESYVWQGLGQYTQAVGGWFFPLAVATTCVALRDGRGYVRATVFLALTFLCHLAVGYMAYLAVGLYALLTPREIPRRLLRLALVAGVSIAVSAYVVVPVFKDFAYYNISSLVPSWKYNSYGHAILFPRLLRGELFDFGRLPVITALVGAGLAVCVARARRESSRLLVVLFVFFFALYLGRPTWGRLLDLLPMGRGFHFSRALFAVHIVGVMMAGSAIGLALRWAFARGPAMRIAAVLATMAVAASPAIDRTKYLLLNASLVQEAADGYAREGKDLEAALEEATDPIGRTYAGQGRPGQGWGGNFMVGWTPVYDWLPFRQKDAMGYLHHMWSLNSDFHDHFDERRPDVYRAFGVTRVLMPDEVRNPSFLREIAREGRFRVLAIDVPGLVDLVDAPYTVEASKRTLARLHRRWVKSDLPGRAIHPRLHLEEEGPAPGPIVDSSDIDFRFPEVPPASAPGEVLSVERTGDDFRIRVRADRPAYALLKMSFHPGWKATVDGEPVAPVHLVPSYLGVPVTEGVHEVLLFWSPGPLKPILLATGLVPLLLLIGLRRRLRF